MGGSAGPQWSTDHILPSVSSVYFTIQLLLLLLPICLLLKARCLHRNLPGSEILCVASKMPTNSKFIGRRIHIHSFVPINYAWPPDAGYVDKMCIKDYVKHSLCPQTIINGMSSARWNNKQTSAVKEEESWPVSQVVRVLSLALEGLSFPVRTLN